MISEVSGENLKKRFDDVLRTTVRVLRDCSVENGAIVAANTDMDYYPKDASPYRFVWIRDAAYVCVAADILEERGVASLRIQKKFFKWCLERPQSFSGASAENGAVFSQRYHTNGVREGWQLQPDQTGTLLWALWHHFRKNLVQAQEFETLIRRAANGICKIWGGKHFTTSTFDLWEERATFPDTKDNHTYSLAACSKGLMCASELAEGSGYAKAEEVKKWRKCALEMESAALASYSANEGYFLRTSGLLDDDTVDASLLGLVYPFELLSAGDERMVNTVRKMEEKIVRGGGVYRYEKDFYDGWVRDGSLRSKGAGAWPLLNFWMSIYYSVKGDAVSAEKYYTWVLRRVDGYIPEQIFENELQKSVYPLAWAHAMFVLASHFLTLL
ncbi:MAG: Glucoamylase [Candidatus Alkanophagales archaeon MCA70_species_2]|nr:Glucoamylase [Candidatus Alkanophaga liquidiphilum]